MIGFKQAFASAFLLPSLLAIAFAALGSIPRGDRIALTIGAALLAVCALAVWFDARSAGALRPLLDLSAWFPLAIALLYLARLLVASPGGAVSIYYLAVGLILLPLGFIFAAACLTQGHA